MDTKKDDYGYRDLRSKAFKLIILMGIVSFFGDVTYEGARSITAPYLATFGVSALVVGLVSGAGEFLGYALRLVSGFLVDKTRRYWLITFVGYGLILSIPLIAFASGWQIVALLIVLERMGKAVRSPAKDSIISFATKKVGRGWGFGIHEAIDQFGAVLGPLILFYALYFGWNFQGGFSLLFLPAILCILFLALARFEFPRPEVFEEASVRSSREPSGFTPFSFFLPWRDSLTSRSSPITSRCRRCCRMLLSPLFTL